MPRGCSHYRCPHRPLGCTCRPLASQPLSHMNGWSYSFADPVIVMWGFTGYYGYHIYSPQLPSSHGYLGEPCVRLYRYTILFPYLYNNRTSHSA